MKTTVSSGAARRRPSPAYSSTSTYRSTPSSVTTVIGVECNDPNAVWLAFAATADDLAPPGDAVRRTGGGCGGGTGREPADDRQGLACGAHRRAPVYSRLSRPPMRVTIS